MAPAVTIHNCSPVAVLPFCATDITAALKSALPEGTLHPSCPITSYRVLPDNTIQLLGPRPLGDAASTSSSDPSSSSNTSNNEEHVVATCNLLVGADGWFSPIRQQLLGDGPPAFKDCVVWRARIKRPEDFPEDRTRWWIPPTGARAGDVLAVLIPLPGGDLVWQCHAPIRVLAEKGLSFDPVKGEAGSSHASNNTASTGDSSSSSGSEQTPKERCLQAFAGFPAPFLDMVKATPAAAITEHGLYQRTPEQIPDGSWGAGSVTLAGDAAHAAYVDGTGLALSLEDAAVLGWHVQQLGLTPAALRAYEAERIPRVKAIFELAARQAAAPRGSQNPEAWAERAELLYGGANFQPLGPGAAVGQQAAAVAPKEPVAASM
jgi:2-polyprenyl-6-methoxyphenol hydroxylase-like FAD-dependent oxidoreductase